MKSFLVAIGIAGLSLAQRIAIGAPADGTSVAAGSNFTVEVDRPNSLTGSQEIAVVIGLSSCANRPGGNCASLNASDVLGSILHSGPYTPQYQSVSGQGFKPPYQNFSVQVPSTMTKGLASLTVTHLSLVGAGPFPFLETQNITLNVV